MDQRAKVIIGILGCISVALVGVVLWQGTAVSASDDDRAEPARSETASRSDDRTAGSSETDVRRSGGTEATRSAPAEPRRSWLGRVFTTPTVTLPAGSEIPVALAVAISSSDMNNGDTFGVTLARDLVDGARVLVPAGTRAVGQVVELDRSGRVEGRERIVLTLKELELPGGSRTLVTSPVTLVAEGTKKRDAAVIGGVAAAGAIIGAITGGGDGAAKGAAVGGAGGTAVVLSTRGEDVDLPVGHHLTFRLTQAMELPAPE